MNLPVAVRGHPGHRTIGGGFDVLAVDAWANMTRNGLHLDIRDTPEIASDAPPVPSRRDGATPILLRKEC